MEIYYAKSPEDALSRMTDKLIKIMQSKPGLVPFNLALSGGSTAQRIFALWQEEYKQQIDWNRIRFYWVDERCVSPEDDESNFKHADQQLFRPIGIPRTHIYRIFGEKDPSMEANRYSELINQQLPKKNGLPYFDAIILGIGLDGHTASIFSSCNFLLNDTRSYAVAVHPESKQLRITLTGPVILNSTPLLVPVIGENKKAIFERLLEARTITESFPAACIMYRAASTSVFTDIKER